MHKYLIHNMRIGTFIHQFGMHTGESFLSAANQPGYVIAPKFVKIHSKNTPDVAENGLRGFWYSCRSL